MTYAKELKNRLLVRTVAGALSLTLVAGALPVHFVHATPETENADRSALAQYALGVRQANQVIYSYMLEQSRGTREWNARRGQPGGPNEDFDLLTGSSKYNIRPPTAEEMKNASETQNLVLQYYGHQGMKRYLGTFVESGSSYADGYQWDTQRWAGLKIPSLTNKLLDRSVENDLLNIRIGVNLHDLDVQSVVNLCVQAWNRGVSPTLSILFFSSLKNWETLGADGKVDPSRSYLNHPEFAKDAEKIAEKVMRAVWKAADQFNAENAKLAPEQRKPEARVAVNPVNEPETFAGFQHFWHGAFAKWGDPNTMRLYVPSVINIAKANVLIRMAADRAAGKRRTLYFHNEAMTPKDYPSHKGDGQFAVSKFMLGDPDLMKADLKALMNEPLDVIQARFDAEKAKGHTNVVDWAVLASANVPANVTAEQKRAAQVKTVTELQELQNLHRSYQQATGKTAKTDTIIMLDYYQQSEFILPKPVPQMIQDFSEKNGEMLKKILAVQDGKAFLQVLEERTRQAEKITGQKLWHDYQSREEINFTEFLKQEDGIILDKLIGLRNEWNLLKDPEFVARRTRAGLTPELDKFSAPGNDEKRDDAFLNELVAEDAKLLKIALDVTTNAQLKQILLQTAAQKGVRFTGMESVREILNASERAVLHSIFGLERFRRTGFLPPHYARQTRAQMRKGLYETYLHYISELGIRIGGIGESGTPYYPWAALVHKQMILAAMAAARTAHMYFVRYDLGPLVGTVGWMNGPMIGNIKTNGKRGSDGILKLVHTGKNQFDYAPSFWPGQAPWFVTFKNELLQGLEMEKARVQTKTQWQPTWSVTPKSKVRATSISCPKVHRPTGT